MIVVILYRWFQYFWRCGANKELFAFLSTMELTLEIIAGICLLGYWWRHK